MPSPCKDERLTKIDYLRETYDENGNINPKSDWKERNDKKCWKLALEDDETIKFACNGDNIAKVCSLTCDTCPGVCFDDDVTRFIYDSRFGKMKGCKWLHNNNDDSTIREICMIVDLAKFYCKETCGMCF